MASHGVVTLNIGTPVRLTPNGMHSGMDITIQSVNEDGWIYVGANDTVSPTNYGYRIAPNNAWSVELPGREVLWVTSSIDLMSIAVFKIDLERSA